MSPRMGAENWKATRMPKVQKPQVECSQETKEEVMSVRWLFTLGDLKSRCVINKRGCWLWQGHTDTRGYGQVWIAQVFTLLHRWAFEQAYGVTLVSANHCCHDCDTPNCVNAEHVFLGASKDNAQDSFSKGRRTGAIKPKLDWDKVKEIRQLSAAGFNQSQIGRRFGVNQTTIRDILIGDSWVKPPQSTKEEAYV